MACWDICAGASLGNGKIAYVWVDALRFEMARDASRSFRSMKRSPVVPQTARSSYPTARLLPTTAAKTVSTSAAAIRWDHPDQGSA